MCEKCNQIQSNSKLQVNAKSYDPTRTTVLRNAFVKDLNKRFTKLIALINQAVIVEDCFGLQKPEPINVFIETPGHKAFQFGTSQQKVDAFMTWLNGQVDKTMLEVSTINQVGTGVNNAWTNKYISDSYKRGVIRARYELQKAGFHNIPTIDATGGINLSMTTPFHIDRLGVLYSRTYNDLKGITNAMDTQISRILAQGIADGDNPRLLAKKIVNEIDGSGTGDLATKGMSAKRRAEILARTEIIRAHHQATIQEYRNWGAADVKVEAEFQTAGDDRVCEQCKELNGKIYTLDQIQNMIPVHPQCRCIALPTLPDEDLEEIPTETLNDPVADNFKDPEDGKEYISYKEGYKKWFTENFTPQELEAHHKLSLEGRLSLESTRNKLAQGLEEFTGSTTFKKVWYSWQTNPQESFPMQMKYLASKLENQAGELLYFGTKKKLTDKDVILSKAFYLKHRAFNQAYLELINVKDIELFRGIGGKTGKSIVNTIKSSADLQRTKWIIPENSLAGFSSMEDVAEDFKGNSGFYYKIVAPRESIFLCSDLLSGVSGMFGNEGEYILLSGKRSVAIKNIVY